MYRVVLVSSVPQRDSVIHVHVSILLQILLPFRLLNNIEQRSLCSTVGPCRLRLLTAWTPSSAAGCGRRDPRGEYRVPPRG